MHLKKSLGFIVFLCLTAQLNSQKVEYGCDPKSPDIKIVDPENLQLNKIVDEIGVFRHSEIKSLINSLKPLAEEITLFVHETEAIGVDYMDKINLLKYNKLIDSLELKYNHKSMKTIKRNTESREVTSKFNSQIIANLNKNTQLMTEIGDQIYGKCKNIICSDRDPVFRTPSKGNFATNVHRDISLISEWSTRMKSWFNDFSTTDRTLEEHLSKYDYFNMWVCVSNCNDSPLGVINPTSLNKDDFCENGSGGIKYRVSQKWLSYNNFQTGDVFVFPGIFTGYHAAMSNNKMMRMTFEIRCRCDKNGGYDPTVEDTYRVMTMNPNQAPLNKKLIKQSSKGKSVIL